jgi:hypothetical protein
LGILECAFIWEGQVKIKRVAVEGILLSVKNQK